MHAITLALRICLSSFSAVALLTARRPADLSAMRALISSEVNTSLLQASPVGLLALVLEQKTRFWGQWDARYVKVELP